MGLMPPTDRARYIEAWALETAEKSPRDRLAVGMRVYCVLYGTCYGQNPRGTVTWLSEDGEHVAVKHDDSCETSSAAAYYVPIPSGMS